MKFVTIESTNKGRKVYVKEFKKISIVQKKHIPLVPKFNSSPKSSPVTDTDEEGRTTLFWIDIRLVLILIHFLN